MHHPARRTCGRRCVALYLIKGKNKRKHDSHGWFFRICRDLPEMIMMTDTAHSLTRCASLPH